MQDSSLLFPSSIVFDGSTPLDRVRQSIIDLSSDPPGADEAAVVISDAIAALEGELDVEMLQSIAEVLALCFCQYKEEVVADFRKVYENREKSINYVFCAVYAIAYLKRRGIHSMLPEGYEGFVQKALSEVKTGVVCGHNVPEVLQSSLMYELVSSVNWTKEIVEEFVPELFKQKNAVRCSLLLQKAIDDGMTEFLPKEIISRENMEEASPVICAGIISSMSTERFTEMLSIWEGIADHKEDRTLSKALIVKAISTDATVSNLSKVMTPLDIDDVTPDVVQYMLKCGAKLPRRLRGKMSTDRIDPLSFMKIDTKASDVLSEETVSDVLNGLNDWDTLAQIMGKHLINPVLGTEEFWVKLMNLAKEEKAVRSNILDCWVENVGDSSEILNAMLFHNFPPAAQQCGFILDIVTHERVNEDIDGFDDDETMNRIFDALATAEDIVTPPPYLLWGITTMNLLQQRASARNANPIFVEGYACNVAVYHRCDIESVSILPQTDASLKEVYKYYHEKEADKDGSLFKFTEPISKRALSLIAAAHLYAASKCIDETRLIRVGIKKVNTVNGLTETSIIPFFLLCCQYYEHNPSNGKMRCTNAIGSIGQDLWTAAMELASHDAEVMEIVDKFIIPRICTNATESDGTCNFPVRMAILNTFVPLLVAGTYKGNAKDLLTLAIQTSNGKKESAHRMDFLLRREIHTVTKPEVEKFFKKYCMDLSRYMIAHADLAIEAAGEFKFNVSYAGWGISTMLISNTKNDAMIINTSKFSDKICHQGPIVKFDGADQFKRIFIDLIERESWEDLKSVITWAVKSGNSHIFSSSFVDKKVPFEISIAILKNSKREDITADALVSLLSVEQVKDANNPTFERENKDLSLLDHELFNIMANTLMDKETTMNYLMMILERIHDRFSRLSSAIHAEFLQEYSLYRDAFIKALTRLYVMPDGTQMLMLKPQPDPMDPISEFGVSVFEKLMSIEKHNITSLYWLKSIANMFPFLVTDKLRVITFANNCMETGFEEYFNSNEPNTKTDQLLFCYAAMMLMYTVVKTPSGMDAFMPWFFANAPSMTNSQLFGCVCIMKAMYTVPSIQHVMTSVMMANGWSDVALGILQRDMQPTDFKKILLSNLYTMIAMYYRALNNCNDEMIATAQEIGTSDTPFLEAFDNCITIPVQFPKTILTSQVIPASVTTLLGYFDKDVIRTSRTDTHVDIDSFNVDIKKFMDRRTYTGFVPDGIDANAFSMLPIKMQSTILFHSLPPVPNSMNQAMYRYLVHQPTWIVQWVKTPSRLLLTPEQYSCLIPVLNELNGLKEDTTMTESEDFTLCDLTCVDLFDALIKQALSETDGISQQLLTIFHELSQNFALTTILQQLSEVLSSNMSRTTLVNTIIIIMVMSQSELFKSNFTDLCGDALLDKILMLENRSNRALLRSTARLMLSLGENIPNKITQFISFMLISNDDTIVSEALKLCENIEESKREIIMAYVDNAFTRLLSEHSSENYHKIGNFLKKFPTIAKTREIELLALLNDLLEHYDRSLLDVIGQVLSVVAPTRNSSQSIRRTDSHSVELTPASSQQTTLPLPGSVISQAPEFWKVFAEHRETISRIIQRNPKLLMGSFKFLNMYPELLDFSIRAKLFRENMMGRLGHNRLNITVNRSSILGDSFRILSHKKPEELLVPFHIKFIGEQGYDAGGLRRDWFTSLVKEIFNPDYGLFMLTGTRRSYMPNPASYVNRDHKNYFRFAGKIIARALMEGTTLDAHLTPAVYKHILKSPLSLRDLEAVDESLYNSLTWFLNNKINDMGLDMQFTADYDYMGKHETIDLKPNGSNIELTDENKDEFVSLMLELRLGKQISEQMKDFCEGFYSIIPYDNVRGFSPNELDLLICGVPEIDIDDLKRHCQYNAPYNANHPVVKLFFKVVSQWDNEQLAKLLLFLTGSSQLPIGGFKYFVDIGQPIIIAPGGDQGRLPVAHTCMNTLDLPEYRNEEDLNRKLSYAISECNSFGII